MRRRGFVLAGLLVTILLAGGLGYWASDSPDGLNRVAMDEGFNAHERAPVTSGSPLAGYESTRVKDPWLSSAVAGVTGVAICFAVAGGAAFAIRRKRSDRTSTGTRRQADEPRDSHQGDPG